MNFTIKSTTYDTFSKVTILLSCSIMMPYETFSHCLKQSANTWEKDRESCPPFSISFSLLWAGGAFARETEGSGDKGFSELDSGTSGHMSAHAQFAVFVSVTSWFVELVTFLCLMDFVLPRRPLSTCNPRSWNTGKRTSSFSDCAESLAPCH